MEGKMEVLTFSNGLFDSNAYILYEREKGILIDAGVPKERILKEIQDKNINIETIILTHGHIDHIYYVDDLKKALKAKVAIHKLDSNSFINSQLNGSSLFGMPKNFNKADRLLIEGDYFLLGDNMLKIIHTPGHNEGSICIVTKGMIFSGDTLFNASIGRTDLPGGSLNQIIASIKNKIYTLPDDTKIYPGHGPSTSVEYEKRNNPYISIDNNIMNN
jgi:hydroxyacylglutathione hydrolase